MSERAIVILAGGAGTRLWPLSTDANPKQFLKLFDGQSLLQRTFERLSRHADPASIFISTNAAYREKVAEQLPSLLPDNILVEPARRNTAPAIASCCAIIAARLGDPVIGIFPSDHSIGDPAAFGQTIDRAFDFAAANDYLMTIGIDPTEPNTGFGYLEVGGEIEPRVFRLQRFVEKPDRARAEEFVASGRFAWNGGMFVWKSATFFHVLDEVAPEIARRSREYAAASEDSRRAIYEQMPSISIDYAVMEKARRVATVRGDFDWSDVGSWSAVARVLAGTKRPEHLLTEQSFGNLVLTGDKRPTVLVGVSDLAVIESPDGLLVLDLRNAELLSAAVKRLKE